MSASGALEGTLEFTRSGTQVLRKNVSQTFADCDQISRWEYKRIADGTSFSVTIPGTTGYVFAVFILSGGPLTYTLNAIAGIPLTEFVISETDFTVLTITNASGGNADVDIIVGGVNS